MDNVQPQGQPQGGLNQARAQPKATDPSEIAAREIVPQEKPEAFDVTKALANLDADRAKLDSQIQKMQQSLLKRTQLPFDPKLMALGIGLAQPTKTGSFFESLGQGMGAFQKATTDEMAREQGVDTQNLDLLMKQQQLRQKLAGKGAGMGDGIFGDLLAPKVDWRKALREFIQEMCQGRDESTWRKPNRRFLADDIYMPSMQGITITELVIGFDTSGSVFGGDEMTRFVSELRTIIEQVKPGKVHVIYWDTAVAGHQTFEDGQFAVQDLKIKGGGGTDGSVLFDYLKEKNLSPQAIVQFTDGYVGDWGRTTIPTLWAVTSNLVAPFGTTIHLDI